MRQERLAASGEPRMALRMLSGLLAVLFMVSGAENLQGAEQCVRNFARWGYPDWLRVLVGAVEVASAVLLPVPRTTFVGAIPLIFVSAGATYTHLFRAAGEGGSAATLVLLALLCLLAYARRP